MSTPNHGRSHSSYFPYLSAGLGSTEFFAPIGISDSEQSYIGNSKSLDSRSRKALRVQKIRKAECAEIGKKIRTSRPAERSLETDVHRQLSETSSPATSRRTSNTISSSPSSMMSRLSISSETSMRSQLQKGAEVRSDINRDSISNTDLQLLHSPITKSSRRCQPSSMIKHTQRSDGHDFHADFTESAESSAIGNIGVLEEIRPEGLQAAAESSENSLNHRVPIDWTAQDSNILSEFPVDDEFNVRSVLEHCGYSISKFYEISFNFAEICDSYFHSPAHLRPERVFRKAQKICRAK
ncbi:uncharacterized protein V1516DRAFT_678128 [Lipomyces oligophaga]|uniref:uncharacterized protein n=1 Tax=Lipomyces oligophaga TaxID=45792 RepID=UPI0034CED9E7